MQALKDYLITKVLFIWTSIWVLCSQILVEIAFSCFLDFRDDPLGLLERLGSRGRGVEKAGKMRQTIFF